MIICFNITDKIEREKRQKTRKQERKKRGKTNKNSTNVKHKRSDYGIAWFAIRFDRIEGNGCVSPITKMHTEI